MPHNGFIYEASMDMMENSGHWLIELQVQLNVIEAKKAFPGLGND